MSAEAAGAIAALQAAAPTQQLAQSSPFATSDAAAGVRKTPGFGELVAQGLEHVNQQLLTSQTDLQNLATGNVQNLHHIMIRLEESKLSFQLMMQVRNRLLEAYQDVMKMQV